MKQETLRHTAERICLGAERRLITLETQENTIIAAAIAAAHAAGWSISQRHALLLHLEETVRDINAEKRLADLETLHDRGISDALRGWQAQCEK